MKVVKVFSVLLEPSQEAYLVKKMFWDFVFGRSNKFKNMMQSCGVGERERDPDISQNIPFHDYVSCQQGVMKKRRTER